VFKVSNKTDYN